MPPVDRNNPVRAKSSDSRVSFMEFIREYPDDAACLDYLWRTRYAEDGEHAECPKCEHDAPLQAVRDDAAAPVVDMHRLRPPHPPDSRDDLPQVLHVAALVVLRDLPHVEYAMWDLREAA